MRMLICLFTQTPNSCSSPASFQPALLQPIQGYIPNGNTAANIALKFDTSGNLQWSTFFGNSTSGLVEEGVPVPRIVVDGNGAAYILDTSTIPPTPNSLGPSLLIPGAVSSTETLNYLLKIAPSLGAPVPIVSPRQLAFTNQDVGSSSTSADVQVGNFGDAPASPTVTITGDFSETDDCSVGVPGGQKCDINVVFKPSVAGPRTGTLTVSFNGNIASQTVLLSGNGGAPAATLSPISLSFPVQATGTTSAAQQITITNSGTGPLTITSLQTSGPFASTNTCGAPVAPSSDCTVQVTFTPTASGTQTGTLTITDNASGSPQTVPLTGNQPATITIAAAAGSPTSATVTAGQTATYDLSVGGTNGFSGTVNFTCSGAPAKSTCSVTPNPASVTAKTPSAVTVSVITQASGALAARRLHWRIPFGPDVRLITAAGIALLLLMGIPTAGLVGRSRSTYAYAFVVACLVAVCIGCGGGGGSTVTQPPPTGTQSGQYTLTLTASSGSITQTMNLSLTVK
jgi:Abnormal spindle-like microcephaly-assoc'd, ASPM-SPD-2-Hydin